MKGERLIDTLHRFGLARDLPTTEKRMKYKITLSQTATDIGEYMQIISDDGFKTNIVLIGEFELDDQRPSVPDTEPVIVQKAGYECRIYGCTETATRHLLSMYCEEHCQSTELWQHCCSKCKIIWVVGQPPEVGETVHCIDCENEWIPREKADDC